VAAGSRVVVVLEVVVVEVVVEVLVVVTGQTDVLTFTFALVRLFRVVDGETA